MKKDKVLVSCSHCSIAFLVNPSELKFSKHLFCCRKCYELWQRTSIAKKCDHCGKKISIKPSQENKNKTKKFFCSYSCRGKYFRVRTPCLCKVCGKGFERTPGEIKAGGGKFCSWACHKKYYSGEKSFFWAGGKWKNPYVKGWNEKLREKIRKRDGYKCSLCGVPQQECLDKLTIHHINYDKKDNSELNLVALCRRCHGKTNHFREKWIKQFNKEVGCA